MLRKSREVKTGILLSKLVRSIPLKSTIYDLEIKIKEKGDRTFKYALGTRPKRAYAPGAKSMGSEGREMEVRIGESLSIAPDPSKNQTEEPAQEAMPLEKIKARLRQ